MVHNRQTRSLKSRPGIVVVVVLWCLLLLLLDVVSSWGFHNNNILHPHKSTLSSTLPSCHQHFHHRGMGLLLTRCSGSCSMICAVSTNDSGRRPRHYHDTTAVQRTASLSLHLLAPTTRRMRRSCFGMAAVSSSSSSDDSIGSSSDSLHHDMEQQQQQQEQLLRQKKRQLTWSFLTIGVPTLLQLTAEPLAGLVDTAYLGRLGPEVLGGAGVAISAHYAVSKLYNDPLLRTSISLVAASSSSTTTTSSDDTTTKSKDETTTAAAATTTASSSSLSVAVSSALLLAMVVGVVQMLVYVIFCRGITRAMGVTETSSMWSSAVSYLQIRAYGTPAATLWLVTNGIFRGLGDTRTPLFYSLLFTGLNAILDPIFIFVWHWGASGAAAGTALAQYIALIPLLYALHRKVNINNIRGQEQWRALRASIRQYLSAGSYVLVRSVGKVAAYAVCARQAALLGSVAAAAYNLTFQLGFATTQICEAVAVAVQTLLARELSSSADTTNASPSPASSLSTAKATTTSINQPQPPSSLQQQQAAIQMTQLSMKASIIRHLINTSLWMGGGVATVLALITYLRQNWIIQGLTSNLDIQNAALSIFPVVLLTQILKGLAYPVNGIIMGGLDWFNSMMTMWLANIVCVGMVWQFGRLNNNIRGTAAAVRGGLVTLNQLWWSLAAFMGTQVIGGIIRFQSKRGVWRVLRHEPKTKQKGDR